MEKSGWEKTCIKYGFKSHKDYVESCRKVVLFMIQLNIDYNSGGKIEYIKFLLEKYKTTQLKCSCCNESHEEFLTLDHINNDGMEHHKELRSKGSLFKKMLSKGFKASNYQILCYNCNCSLGNKGYCPHNPSVRREIKHKKFLKSNRK